MAVNDFQWYVDRLDLASWQSEQPGSRSGFFGCPVHGGSDSLHVTEKNGKALITCFGCGADIFAVTEQLENAPESDEGDAPPVTITRTRGRRVRPSSHRWEASRTEQNGDEGSTPSASTISPLDWMAGRCALTRDELDALDLPLLEEGHYLIFDFPGVDAQKLRGVGEGKKGKDFRWRGGANPPLWPMPDDPGDDIVVCEGEADAICLRASGIEAYSITKGSQGEVPASVWEALRAYGVRTIRLVFDADDAGRKGRATAAEGARSAGLHVLESRVVGILPLAGEKDARDVARRQGYPLALEDDADEDLPVLLSDIDPQLPEPLLLGKLHAQEHTILFGDGGTGKGVIAAWLVAQLTRGKDPKRVLVVDYEMHANLEWRPRVEGFGGDMTRVAILQPTRPIWDISGWLRTQASEYDYVVVDSITYACVGEEVEKSVTATKYTMAVNQIDKPTLSIAHVTKQNADPNHPFGSIFWSNGARVTLAVSRKVAEDAESPRMLRNAKTNQRAPFKTVALGWDWLGNDGPPGCDCNNPPLEQRGMPRHLHEVGAYRSKAECVRALARTLGRMPTEAECDAEMPDEAGNFGGATIPNAFRGHEQDRPVSVTRVARIG